MDSESSIDDRLARATPEVGELYHRFIALAEKCGPFTYAVSKSAITLKGVRRGFAGAVLRRDHLGGYLDLVRPIDDDPRIRSVSPYEKRLFVHHFRVGSLDELDDTFAGWLDEAYEVGRGMHLAGPTIR